MPAFDPFQQQLQQSIKRQTALKSKWTDGTAPQWLWPHGATPGVGVTEETAAVLWWWMPHCYLSSKSLAAGTRGKKRWRRRRRRGKTVRWGTWEGKKVARTPCERGGSSWEKGETCYRCMCVCVRVRGVRVRNVGERRRRRVMEKKCITRWLSEVAECRAGDNDTRVAKKTWRRGGPVV